MANVLNSDKQEQIRALGRLGWSLRRIEEATKVRRETISRHLRAAGIALRPPRGRKPPPEVIEPNAASHPIADPEAGLNPASHPIPDLERRPAPGWSRMASSCEPYREWIEGEVARGRRAKTIWQDLVDDHGFTAGYLSVQRFVRKLRGGTTREAHPTIVTEPGEEGQVDYGEGPMVRHPETRRYRRTRLFAFTLGFSRSSVWLLRFRSSSRIWCELHEETFSRLGGAPRTVVLDNLKEGVLKPDVYDPELNPLYRDLLAHYGAVGLPARVHHPDRKGKVERAVDHAQNGPLKSMRFESLEEAQAYLDRWNSRWANTRIHGTTKRQVAAMFEEERPALLPLPAQPFRFYEHGVRTVHLDGCVEVAAAYYGAPPGWVGRQVVVQWDALNVRLIDPKTGELLREHRRKPRGWRQVHPDDVPKRTPPGVLQLLARAWKAGTSIGALCQVIHDRQGEAGVRRIQGVLSLAKRHGIALVDDACRHGLELGVANYRFVRRWIERHPSPQEVLRQVDPLIRELSQYRDLVDRLTQNQDQ
jgi:transposase